MVDKPLFIRAEWDDEALVWVASSDDVPGLATEESTLDGLIQKLKIIIPELMEANGIDIAQELKFDLWSTMELNPDTHQMQF